MINLNLDTGIPDVEQQPYQEGMIGDVLKNVADIDTEKIKNDWDHSTSLYSKAKSLEDNGLAKGREVTDLASDIGKRFQVDNRSIVARARNSVIQFPIYVVQTLRVNEAQIISKLFERVYCTFVQTVLSQNQILSEEEANELVFLKKYHTNLKEAADVLVNKYYEPIDNLDEMMCESIFYRQRLNDNCVVEFSVVPTTDQLLIQENARLMNEPLAGFSYLKEAIDGNLDVTREVTTQPDIRTLTDDDFRNMAINKLDLNQEDIRLLNTPSDEIKNKARKIDKRELQTSVDSMIEEIKRQIKDPEIKKRHPELRQYVYTNGRYIRTDYKDIEKVTTRPLGASPVDRAVDSPTMLKDSDIKKINGMLPYTIEATFRIRTKNGIDRDIRYIVGIKSVLHLIRTQDLAEDLRELVTGNIRSLQNVRYKTGEISFKDYFFHVKDIKADAAKNINYNKKWLNTLKRLAEYDKVKGSLFKHPSQALTGGSVPIPNGTLVLTQPDVTTLANQTGIDLSIVSNAKRLAKSLFLIAVVIVDSSSGSMRVLFPDMDTDWDVQSLASIDAEVSKTDNSQLMKEIQRVINR